MSTSYMNIAHSSSAGIAAVSNASADTKGNWAQGIASTAAKGCGIQLFVYHSTAANKSYTFDVGIGASSSEVVLVPDVHIRLLSTSKFAEVYIPCEIPAGSRVSFRCMDDAGSGALRFAGFVVPETAESQPGFATSAKFTNPKFTGASGSGYVNIDAGGTVNTFSGTAGNICNADAPIAATHILLATRDSNAAAVNYLVRILVNGVVVTPELYHMGTNAQGEYRFHRPIKLDTPIALNDTVTAEVSCSGNTVGSRELRVAVNLMELPALSSGSGSITIGGGMERAMKDGETTASKKRVFFDIRDSAGAGWSGSVTGVKAKLSVSGAASADSTNDIVRVTTPLHYVELDNTEAGSAAAGDVITAWVPADTGRLASTIGTLHVIADDPSAAALTISDFDAAELSVDVVKINSAPVQGDGTSGDLWRGV